MWADLASLRKRLAIPAISLIATHLLGTAGFWWLWHPQQGTWLDALYMTFLTVTTVGFGEPHPLGTAGRVITMIVAAGGIGSLFYSFTVVLEWAGSDQIRQSRRKRRMQKQIDGLSGHYVLAGFGRVGREAAAGLREAKFSVVVIDPDPEHGPLAIELGCSFLLGDATDDGLLTAAGITRARGLIVTTATDATNLFVVLSARLLNPGLYIASRAVDRLSVAKPERAGANRAISPHAVGGRRLAQLMVSPRVVDFFETALHRGGQSLSIGEILITSGTRTAGQSLETLQLGQKTGATLLAVVHPGSQVTIPQADLVLAAGDHLLALGTSAQLEQLEVLVAPT